MQAFVDERRELQRQVVARLQVVALEEIERPGLAGRDLLADLGRLHRAPGLIAHAGSNTDHQNASRIAETTERAKSVDRRSMATRSCSRNAAPSQPEAGAARQLVLIGEASAGFSHSVFCCFTSSNLTLTVTVKR